MCEHFIVKKIVLETNAIFARVRNLRKTSHDLGQQMIADYSLL